MSYLSDISLRKAAWIFIMVLAVLIAGAWTTIKLTTDHLLNANAKETARHWANFLAANITDFEQIAAGERPSSASLHFFEAARKAGHVFRYVVYNREGYSQLVSGPDGIASVELSEFSPEAVEAVASGRAFADVRTGNSPAMPQHFAEAFVPVHVDGRPVAVVAAYVDQTRQYPTFFAVILGASIALCGLTGVAFGVPAVAWYRRTREKQQADRRIQFLAHHDVLTGLANRARLIERLDGTLALLPTTKAMVALHFIDIDYFKQVNDTLGHDGGDFLLKTIGERLRSITRIEDMVARLGGDEFVIVQTGLADRKDAEEFAKRVAAELCAPMYYKEQEIRATLTIGVAVAPEDGVTSERLLKSADLALYAGKSSARNCIRFFTPDMDEALQKRIKLERAIRDAVEHNTFQIHYQPVFEMNGRHLIGFEALARMPAEDGELIAPATFIPMAEELRLIDRIGRWVLMEACRAAASWPSDLSVSVNLSPVQFESGDIEIAVAEALKQSGLEPHRLELEITESLLLSNSELTLATLRRLKEMGVSIVMDDFGTGYSSLSYLWKFPFDKIKIDRSFMEGFDRSGRDVETVIKTIIALGREMNMRVTMEGVETAEQVSFLYDIEADQVQGFYFGRPVPADAIAANVINEFRKSLPPAASPRQSEPVPGQAAAAAS